MEETEADIKCACNHLTSFTVVQVYIIYVCALNVCVRVCVFTYMVDVHECVTLTAWPLSLLCAGSEPSGGN